MYIIIVIGTLGLNTCVTIGVISWMQKFAYTR